MILNVRRGVGISNSRLGSDLCNRSDFSLELRSDDAGEEKLERVVDHKGEEDEAGLAMSVFALAGW